MELWARNGGTFCLNVDFHATFRVLLHAVKLRHGTDGFTSPPKEGVHSYITLTKENVRLIKGVASALPLLFWPLEHSFLKAFLIEQCIKYFVTLTYT